MATVVVNNVTYDLQNCEVEIVGINGSFGIIRELEELSYSSTINREGMRGSHRNVVDWTDGEGEHESSITVQKTRWDYLVAVAQEFGIGLALMNLTIGATYFKDGILVQDTLWKCRVSNPEHSFQRGPDTLKVPIGFDVANIFYNGVDLFGLDVGSAV